MNSLILLLVSALLLSWAIDQILPFKHAAFGALRAARHTRLRRVFFSGFEPLEARMCPAVTFGFDAGVLTATGDDGPNAISLLQSGDRTIQATGDGQSQTFSNVDQVIINAGGGDDQIFYHGFVSRFQQGKSRAQINAGAGSDTIVVEDGDPRGPVSGRITGIAVDPIDVGVDLGTGADMLAVSLQHHENVDLNVLSSDGGDTVGIVVLLPAVQKVREAAARVHLELGAGGNLVDVRTTNYDNVDVSLDTAARAPATAALAGDSFTFQFNRLPATAGEGTNTSEGIFVFTGHYAPPAAGSAMPSSFDISANGFERNTMTLVTGGGDDTVNAQFGDGSVRFIKDPVRLDLNVDLGAGNDRLMLESAGYANVTDEIILGDGDDTAQIRHRMFAIVDRTQLNVTADLGAGSDLLLFDSSGYRNIVIDVDTGPLGDGRDFVLGTHVAHGTYQGWGKWEVNLARIPSAVGPVRLLDTPLDDGADRAVWITVGFFEVSQSQTEPTRQITLIQDL